MNINEKMFPPYACFPFFEQFEVGQKINIAYNGNMGGVWEIEGYIKIIDSPTLQVVYNKGKGVQSIDLTMGNIQYITLKENDPAVKKRMQNSIRLPELFK